MEMAVAPNPMNAGHPSLQTLRIHLATINKMSITAAPCQIGWLIIDRKTEVRIMAVDIFARCQFSLVNASWD
jgi:hypothetical protein